MVSCPFGAITYDTDRRSLMKCDLCGGDPQCVRFCPTDALKFLPKKKAPLPKESFGGKLDPNRTRAIRRSLEGGE